MKILLAHPSVAPFVQQAARALDEAGWLDRFVTTIRHNPRSVGQRIACTLSRGVGFDLARQLARREVTELPPDRVESLPWGEWLRLFAGRIDRSGRLVDAVWARTEPAFDRAVARRLTRSHDVVYGFEYASLATFTRARELGIRTCYDVPAPEAGFVHSLLEAEAKRFPALRTAYQMHTSRQEHARTARRRAEWDAADLVLAASNFTRDSFAHAGRDVSKIRVVPYGAPAPLSAEIAAQGGSRTGPLQLLWAGTFSVRKGAHYLLEAWRRHDLGRGARLRIFGSVTLPDELVHPLPAGIELCGSVPRPELMAQYQASDALVFPSLCDGFGMVVTEAWSCGLPVLTTRAAGASDLVRHRENGLIVPARDPDELATAIMWCAVHRDELLAMRRAARDTAASWQWADYRAALRAAVAPDESAVPKKATPSSNSRSE